MRSISLRRAVFGIIRGLPLKNDGTLAKIGTEYLSKDTEYLPKGTEYFQILGKYFPKVGEYDAEISPCQEWNNPSKTPFSTRACI